MKKLKLIEKSTSDIEQYLMEELQKMKTYFNQNPYLSYKERKATLQLLKTQLLDNKDELVRALNDDYGYRSEFDSLLSDILPTISLLNYTLKKMKKWMRVSKRHAGFLLMPSKVRVHYQPLGVVGIITPWNFPVFLALGPAIQALAAGNRVIIKMSEDTLETNKVLREILAPLSEHVIITEDILNLGPEFSKLPFDHLVFTGSTQVGKLVATAAAKNLTPITLELGGKSPTIVADDIKLDAVINQILLGKTLNSGQICVAPDYVFIPKQKQEDFIALYLKKYKELFLDSNSVDRHTHIVNERQYQRLQSLVQEVKDNGAEISTIETAHQDDYLMLPHLVSGDLQHTKLMEEEIFGSILPVIAYTNIDEVIAYINSNDRPLAIYVMTNDKQLVKKVIRQTHSGGVGVNEIAMHVMADDAPFGGVGYSGIGHYHGYEGFQTFSKPKTVLYSKSWIPKSKFVLKNRDFVKKFAIRFLLK